MKIEQARGMIRFYMRQANGGFYPTKIRYSPALAELVDEATAQKIYDEEIARLEAANGMKLPRWDSAADRPLAGTPRP